MDSQRTILIVDDEDMLRNLLISEFEAEGWKVYGASNGVEGLKIFQAHRPKVILSDVRMPGGNGIDMLKAIDEETRKQLIVYFMSGFSDYSVDEVKQLGAFDIIDKPFKLFSLIEKLTHLVSDFQHKSSEKT